MSAATSPYEMPAAHTEPARAPPLQRGDGAAEIGFARRGGETVLVHLYQRTPLRVLFPRPAPGDLAAATLLTTSGGLAGGDRLSLSIRAEAGAAGSVTTAAAEKIYRSLGPPVTMTVTLAVAQGGRLDYLPQETILFDGAKLRRRIDALLAPDGCLLASEMVVFGRAARGERFTRGLLHDAWRIRIGGRLVWADALRLEGDIAARLDEPAAFGGAAALALALYVGADGAQHLPLARSLADAEGCHGSTTLVNGVLLARFLGARADIVRRALTRYLAGMRQAAGLPAALPRMWST